MSLQSKIENVIEKDKLIHFCIGLLLAQFAYLWFGFIALPLIIGIAKELYDKYVRKTGFNYYDLLATGLGCMPVIFIYFIDV